MESDSSDGADEDWIEEMEEPTLAVCLFCDKKLPSVDEIWSHTLTDHNLNFCNYAKQCNLDSLSYVKMVNFIRKNNSSVSDISCHFANSNDNVSSSRIWSEDVYLKPVIADDALLQFDVESLWECEDQNAFGDGSAKVEQLEKMVNELKIQLQLAVLDPLPANSTNNSNDFGPSKEIDPSYFETYAHFAIHEEMLKDRIRTCSYRDAILKNSSFFTGKTVVDVGCGTGILSLFAAKAGAADIIAIDFSDIAYSAMDIVRENNCENIISVKHCRVEDVELSDDKKADILVSEWMGYFLLYECMLDAVIFARDHLLKPDGIVLPNKYELYVAAFSDESMSKDHVDFWDDIYGFKMSCMKKDVVKEPSVCPVRSQCVVSNSALIKAYDLNDRSTTSSDLEFVSDFWLKVTKNCEITGLVGHFDTKFDHEKLVETIEFSTSPSSELTHWKQTVFLLPQPLVVTEGDALKGKISVKRDVKDMHGLVVTLLINDKKLTYLFH